MQSFTIALAALPLAQALVCSTSFFASLISNNASVVAVTQLPDNSTYHVPPGNIAYPTSPTQLRALCAVEVKIASSPISSYSFGIFLPDDWNSRFLAVGNGGFAGGINWLDMAAGVGYGFATMSTDTGHNSTSRDGSWALNKESLTDWGHRAMHGSIVVAKQLIAGYYGQEARWSYYSGCSTGGRQGLKEVQTHPEDFDGALIGAPAWWTSHLQTWTIKAGLYNMPNTSEHHIPPSMFPVIGQEVLRQCDGQDGVLDTIVSEPWACDFVVERLLCGPGVRNATAEQCLTLPQIGTLEQIYNDYYETNQTFVFPHINLGAEAQFEVLLSGLQPSGLGTDYARYFVLDDPDWNFYNFDYDIVQKADKLQPGDATANDYDMSQFQARGGKILHYHGLADAVIPTGSSEYFYRQVLKAFAPKGIELDSWYRYFRVPGMQHCAGTATDVNAPWYFAGGNQAGDIGKTPGSVSGVPGFQDAEHDALRALMAWTEDGRAPDHIIATKWHNDTLTDRVLRQRPLCPFPRYSEYIGSGNVNEATSWRCVSHIGLKQQSYS